MRTSFSVDGGRSQGGAKCSDNFSLVKDRLENPLEVEMANEKSLLVKNVVVGMDWRSRYHAHLGCEEQRIMVQTPSGGKLIILGK